MQLFCGKEKNCYSVTICGACCISLTGLVLIWYCEIGGFSLCALDLSLKMSYLWWIWSTQFLNFILERMESDHRKPFFCCYFVWVLKSWCTIAAVKPPFTVCPFTMHLYFQGVSLFPKILGLLVIHSKLLCLPYPFHLPWIFTFLQRHSKWRSDCRN